jgi:hypothetical protein
MPRPLSPQHPLKPRRLNARLARSERLLVAAASCYPFATDTFSQTAQSQQLMAQLTQFGFLFFCFFVFLVCG